MARMSMATAKLAIPTDSDGLKDSYQKTVRFLRFIPSTFNEEDEIFARRI
jgi:hypothetical protein